MEPVRHILVAIDFHPASLRALGYAVRLARTVGGELTLLHVCDRPSHASDLPPPATMETRRASAANDLRALVEGLRGLGLAATGHVREGVPADVILDASRESDADLLVLGTHGRRGLSRLVLGSVAEVVVRGSPVPVVTLHEWRYESRLAAARRLAEKVRPLRGELGLTVAITRGAVPLALEVGRALATPVEVLMVEPIAGRTSEPIGAACEDRSSQVDVAAIAAQHVDAAAVERATEAALANARQRARWLRGPDAPRSIAGANVLVVTDTLSAPGSALVAAASLRKLGAARVSLAVPVCASRVISALTPAIERTLTLDTTYFEPPSARVYRDEEEPSNIEATRMLVKSGLSEPPAPSADRQTLH